MTELAFKLVGGIGLFLLGMVLLTDGVKAFAGDALRRWLLHFTGTPTKAFASGTLVTALVQSSSATTVTVIGFVSAGLLTFPQAVGVVFGASLGTTGTSWVVAGLGLKISVGFYALPLVGIGAFLKLLSRTRWRSLGLALAGFGLIFIGIETLQDAMRGFSAVFELASLPASGPGGYLVTMLIGILLTVVMQSSSAAIATTLTALHADTINFDQASLLVVGAAVGTTVTGALAAIGGSVPAKRTALAHVTFNLATGLIAVALLPVFTWMLGWAQQNLGLEAGAISLAAFHTLFIAVGVLIFLPLVDRFSRTIERVLPDTGPALTRHLDHTVMQNPAVALEATLRAMRETAAELFRSIRVSLSGSSSESLPPEQLQQALDLLQGFLHNIPLVAEDVPLSQTRIAQLHAIEHLTRLQPRHKAPPSLRVAFDDQRLVNAMKMALAILELGEAGLRGEAPEEWLEQLKQAAADLAEVRRLERPRILQQTGSGASDPGSALDLLDAIRWLDVLSYHTWRICHYLSAQDNAELTLVTPDDHPDD